MSGLEDPLEPDRPIIDPHLHHWDLPGVLEAGQEAQRFLFEQSVAEIAQSGHRITHTVFVECHAMVRGDGPDEWRTLGETEFANGIAAMSATGSYGQCRLAHRIVGNVDLCLGDAAEPILDAHIAAAGGRFVGVRNTTAYSENGLFGFPCDPAIGERLRDGRMREGARVLARKGLTLDVWCLHSQLDDLAALADAVPELVIVLDHVGTPERGGRWAGDDPQVMTGWRGAIAALAQRPNVCVKIGGMGMDIGGPLRSRDGPASSMQLAERWRPLAETCIEAFGTERSMFESNFPPDRAAAGYGTTWNAFKRIASGCSEEEKGRLFRGTAARIYSIDLALAG